MGLKKAIPTVLFIIIVSVNGLVLGVAAAGKTTCFSISPPMYIVQSIGDRYNFSVNIYNALNLHSASFTIAFNASTLQVLTVVQKSFFPSAPSTSFQYRVDAVHGFLNVSLSLVSSGKSVNGTGTVASLSFKVVRKPSSCIVSTIAFTKITLLDSSARLVPSDIVGGVCFWKSIGSDPPGPGLITEHTDKIGGFYQLGETVILFANVTFSGAPVANKLVAFQVFNPVNVSTVVAVAFTGTDGIAAANFSIPPVTSSIGTWTDFSTVELDQVTYSDTITFQVRPTITVGGYSFALARQVTNNSNAMKQLSSYAAALIMLSTALIMIKTRKRRK